MFWICHFFQASATSQTQMIPITMPSFGVINLLRVLTSWAALLADLLWMLDYCGLEVYHLVSSVLSSLHLIDMFGTIFRHIDITGFGPTREEDG
jgi:hypothetical protein